MNFGKLLATGKSIISGRRPAAYRENRHVYLPKFESPKNPFVKGTTASAAPASVAPVTPVIPVAQIAPVPRVAAKVAPASIFNPLKTAPPAAPASAQSPKQGTWAARLNPISMFRGSSDAALRSTFAVQTELPLGKPSLDSVKVIENDLSGEEVENVPLKSRTIPPTGAEAAESWNDLGTKIFGANAV